MTVYANDLTIMVGFFFFWYVYFDLSENVEDMTIIHYFDANFIFLFSETGLYNNLVLLNKV